MNRKSMRRLGVPVLFYLCTSMAWSQEVRIDTLQALSAGTSVPGSQRAPVDFNGDGVSDLLWTNPFTHQIAYWLMGLDPSSGLVTRTGAKTFDIPPDDLVAAVGDFTGDGLSDVVLTNANRDLYLWTNDGKGGFRVAPLESYEEGWQPMGAGDVDGDGQDDLLWFNGSSCQFSYWLMKSGVHVGTRTMPVACGYVPLSIGYFTPTQRLSIAWTSVLNDIYIWDGTPTGFASFNVGTPLTRSVIAGFGGGASGTGITAVTIDPPAPLTVFSWGANQVLDRVFDQNARQTGFSWQQSWTSYGASPWGSAGFLVPGHGSDQVRTIQQYSNDFLTICAPGTTDLRFDATCKQFDFPRGWFVVGARANGVVTPVSEASR